MARPRMTPLMMNLLCALYWLRQANTVQLACAIGPRVGIDGVREALSLVETHQLASSMNEPRTGSRGGSYPKVYAITAKGSRAVIPTGEAAPEVGAGITSLPGCDATPRDAKISGRRAVREHRGRANSFAINMMHDIKSMYPTASVTLDTEVRFVPSLPGNGRKLVPVTLDHRLRETTGFDLGDLVDEVRGRDGIPGFVPAIQPDAVLLVRLPLRSGGISRHLILIEYAHKQTPGHLAEKFQAYDLFGLLWGKRKVGCGFSVVFASFEPNNLGATQRGVDPVDYARMARQTMTLRRGRHRPEWPAEHLKRVLFCRENAVRPWVHTQMAAIRARSAVRDINPPSATTETGLALGYGADSSPLDAPTARDLLKAAMFPLAD